MGSDTIKIKGLQKTSLIDYPGKVCSIIFLSGCNFRCPYCQNPDLINQPEKLNDIEPEKVIEHLLKNRKWLDGLCITGGEPTLHSSLPEFIKRVKKKGFLVKLDTNGSNPEMLGHLLRNCLLDYVAMDIKSTPSKYDRAAGVSVDKERIKKSIGLIMREGNKGNIDYEFRATVLPGLFGKQDAITIGKWLHGAKRFSIQQFRPQVTLDSAYQNVNPYSEAGLQELKKIMEPCFESVEIRQ